MLSEDVVIKLGCSTANYGMKLLHQ